MFQTLNCVFVSRPQHLGVHILRELTEQVYRNGQLRILMGWYLNKGLVLLHFTLWGIYGGQRTNFEEFSHLVSSRGGQVWRYVNE